MFVCVDCRNEVGAAYTTFSSTPCSTASAAALPVSGCPPVPVDDVLSGETRVKDGVEESGKMSDWELEEMCARYGGYMRAKHAATVIQQTYRQYLMSRSFAKLRLEAGESRRSQRFTRRRGVDSIDVDRSLDLSQLHDVKVEDTPQPTDTLHKGVQPRSTLEDGAHGTEVGGDTAVDGCEGHDDLEDCDDYSGSSRSLSPTLPPPPLPLPSDLPSVYFESSLEAGRTVCGQHRLYSDHRVKDCMLTVCPTLHSFDPQEFTSSYFRHQRHCCYHNSLDFAVCQHRNNCQTHQRAPTAITTRHSDPNFRPSQAFPAASFARFGVLTDHAEPSPIWKRKNGSIESCDAGVGTSLEEWDIYSGRSGAVDRPWSEVYPGSTTSSEDTGSIGSGDMTSHHLAQNQQNHTSVDLINHSVNSTSSNRSSVTSHSSDRQRKRCYRIGLNLFNR